MTGLLKFFRKMLWLEKHICPFWFSFSLSGRWRRLVHDPGKILAGLIRKGQTVLDIGCGPGFFSLAMARMTGPEGKVIAVDLQNKMLEKLRRQASRLGLSRRIEARVCTTKSLGIRTKADLILAFWMVHEVSDQARFFRQVRRLLKPGGVFLMVEPVFHVSGKRYEKSLSLAVKAGLRPFPGPRVFLSRTALFRS